MPLVIQFSDINKLKKYIKETPDYFIIGKGSNTLINPSPTLPPIIKILPDISPVEVDQSVIRVNAGISVNRLLTMTKKEGLSGLEFIAGVPASVGGMIFMNFGCWGKEISEYIQSVRVIDANGDDYWIQKKDMMFNYRHSSFQDKNMIIVEAELRLISEDPQVVTENIANAIQKRLKSQPLKERTFGSTFKNPSIKPAGQIIEELGFKGIKTQIEQPYMSEHHANFMINTGKSNFESAYHLIQEIKDKAKKEMGINLELEVQLI